MAIVSLIVDLKDKASAGLQKIKSGISSAGNSADNASGLFGKFAGSIAGGIIQANLIQSAFGAVGNAVGFLQGKFAEAAQLQTSALAAANTFASLTGLSIEQGEGVIDRLNDRLAKSAASLPGATQDYKNIAVGIQDNLIPAFKLAGGGFDTAGFENSVAGMAESYTMLGITGGAAASDVNLFLTKALAGASAAELTTLKFAESQPAIVGQIQEELKAQGKDSLKGVDVKKRMQILESIGTKFLTGEFKDRAGNTVEGLTQSFQSTLFDPTTGIFGLMRDLDPDTKGAQTAFASFNEIVKLLLGSDGLFTQFGNLLKGVGIQLIDPMKVLKAGLDLVVGALSFVNNQVKSVVDILNSPFAAEGLSGRIAQAVGYLGGTIGGAIRDAVVGNLNVFTITGGAIALGVASFLNPGYLGSLSAGLKLARTGLVFVGNEVMFTSLRIQAALPAFKAFALLQFGRMQSAVTAIRGLSSASMWTALTTGVRTSLAAVKAFIGASWMTMTTQLRGATIAVRAFAVARWAAASTAITGLLTAIKGFSLVGLITAVKAFSLAGAWGAITAGATAATGAITAFIASSGIAFTPLLIGAGAVAIAAFTIWKFWKPITGFFAGIFSGILEGLQPVAPAMQTIGEAISPITKLISAAFKAIGSLLTPVEDVDGAGFKLGQTIGRVVGGAIGGTVALVGGLIRILQDAFGLINRVIMGAASLAAPVAGFASSVTSSVGSVISNPVGAISNAASSVASGVGSFFGMGTPAPVPAMFNGHIPSAADGLVSAAVNESRRMPSGANLVMANDREFILQDKGAASGGGAGFTANITIYASTFDEIMRQLSAAIRSEMGNQLT